MPTERQGIPRKLDEVGLIKRGGDRVEVELEELQERVVRDVAGGDDEQLPWRPREQVAVSEVPSFVITMRPSLSAR